MSHEQLPRPLINQLLAQAQKSPEAEVCGLIGAGGEAHTLYPIANIAEQADHLFAMEPRGQIDAMRTMREAGETLFAIYHSHPHAPAKPSAADLKEAAYPEALYLIVSLDTKGVLDLRGYRLSDGEFVAVGLEMV